MLDRLRIHTKDIKFYEAIEIPLNRDCFLLSDENLDKIEMQWIEFLSPNFNPEKWEHPNGLMDYIPCHISSITDTNINITLLIDRNLRFHTISKTLPIKFFGTAFKVFSTEKRPYIIVDKNWFNNLRNSIYSTYVFIDFIGIRQLLNQYGEFPADKLNIIKSIVDEFSEENEDLTFLTLADNIIIKSGWTFNLTGLMYQPEKLIKTVHLLMTRIECETKIASYAILTQGANYVNENKLSNSITSVNHYFISSISIPFIEAFEIDNDIRKRIKKNEIKKESFYIEESFYMSTKRKYYSSEEPNWFKKINFESEKLKTKLTYSALSFEKICDLIEINE